MTLSIRWDSSDTVFISGPPSERYVHWPLEISSNTSTSCSVAIWLYDASGAEIASQSYDGVPISSTWGKFNPALLVADNYFATAQTWTLKALIYSTSIPIEVPHSITRTINNTGTGGGASNMLLAALGIGLLLFAFGGKRMLR